MKIGLFGGTFNPFHNGHIRIIEHVKKSYGLEKIFIIPSATPPHKPDTDLAPANDRFEMVRQSIEGGREGFIVSNKELTRKGPSFTIDTIEDFKTDLGEKTDLFLLMGSDAFFDITTWRQKDQIFDSVNIIVMLRGQFENYHAFVSFIDEHISKGYIFRKKDNSFFHETKQKIVLCRVPRIDISSTMIRDRVKSGKSIEGLVPAGVLKIIYEKELYQ